jgi:hypothetical protein
MGFGTVQGAREPVKNVTSAWALLQNGASMNRTSIEILLCSHIPMSW